MNPLSWRMSMAIRCGLPRLLAGAALFTLTASGAATAADPGNPCETLLDGAQSPVAEVATGSGIRSEIARAQEKAIDLVGGFINPFVFANTMEAQIKLWDKYADAFPSLRNVQNEARRSALEGREFSDQLLASALSDAQKILEQGAAADRTALFAVFETLRLLEIQAAALEPAPAANSKEEKKAKEEKEKERKKPKEKKDKQKTPPQLPNLGKQYQPHNKDTESESEGGAQEQLPYAEIPVQGISHFTYVTYAGLSRNAGWTALPMLAAPSASTRIDAHVTVTTHGLAGDWQPLPIPAGYVPHPMTTGTTEVRRDDTGNWIYRSSDASFQYPVSARASINRPLSPPERDLYTLPSSESIQEWPEHLQIAVRQLQDERSQGRFSGIDGDVRLARALGAYIRKKFKYRVDQTSESDSVARAQAGAFQCDTAADILAKLLRREFNIPARPVGGARGKSLSSSPRSSFAVIPFEGHAWVEVVDTQGNWYPVDPTPTEKDRETDQNGEAADYRDNQPEDMDDDSQSGDDPSGDPNQQSGKGGQSKDKSKGKDKASGDSSEDGDEKSLGDLVDEFIEKQKKRLEEARNSKGATGEGDASQGDSEKGEKDGEDGDGKGGKPVITEHAAPQTDQLLNALEKRNPFTSRMMKRLLLWSTSPALDKNGIAWRLGTTKAILAELDKKSLFPATQEFVRSISEAQQWFARGKVRGTFAEQLGAVASPQASQDLNQLHAESNRLQAQVEYRMYFMDAQEKAAWAELHRIISGVKRAVARVRHPESDAIRTAQDLFENLPGNISRELLRERYGITGQPGSDTASLNMARDLFAGKLNDQRVQAILGPHTEFLTDPIEKPSGERIRTWLPQILHRPGRKDLFPTRDPRRKNELVNLNPRQYSDEEALKRGKMYRHSRRQEITLPEGRSQKDPDKVTMVFFDVSGSMAGTNEEFQSQYIGALVDRALSDVGPTGRVRHRVLIVPFGDHVFEPIEIYTVDEARATLRELKVKTRNRGSGTDIQKALLFGAERVKQAVAESDKGLAQATIVLMSDGGSNVDEGSVRTAFLDAKGDQTAVLFAFAAIGGSNPDLHHLATAQNLGADASMYIEWNASDIADVMQKARTLPTPGSEFYSEATLRNLDGADRAEIQRALHALDQAVGRARSQGLLSGQETASTTPATDSLEKSLRSSRGPLTAEKRQGTRSTQLMAFRSVLNVVGGKFSKGERAMMLDQVLAKWGEIMGVNVSELDAIERADLGFILQWVDSGVAGGN